MLRFTFVIFYKNHKVMQSSTKKKKVIFKYLKESDKKTTGNVNGEKKENFIL